jgi:hypothetical protein
MLSPWPPPDHPSTGRRFSLPRLGRGAILILRETEGEALARMALEHPRRAGGTAGMRFALAMAKPRRFPGCKGGERHEVIQERCAAPLRVTSIQQGSKTYAA